MSPLTPRLGLYYPVLADDPDVPDDMRQLALSVEDAAIGWSTGDFKYSFQTADHDQFILCDGLARNRAAVPTAYAALVDSILGVHADPTKVKTPNGRRRSLMGADPGGATIVGVTPNLGTLSGEEKHFLSASESGVNGSGTTGFTGTHRHTNNTDPTDLHHLYNGEGSGLFFAATSPSFGIWIATGTAHSHPIEPDGNHQHPLNARSADASHNTVHPVLFANLFIATGGGGTGTGGGGGSTSGFGAPIALVGGVRQNVVHDLTSTFVTVQAWDAATGVQVDAEPIVVDDATVSLYSALSVNVNVAIVRAV